LATVTISLYTNCVVTANAVLYAGYAMAAVKGFASACYKGKEGVAKGVVYREDREGEQRHKELVASLVKIKLRRL
jgi:hypothetical protein